MIGNLELQKIDACTDLSFQSLRLMEDELYSADPEKLT